MRIAIIMMLLFSGSAFLYCKHGTEKKSSTPEIQVDYNSPALAVALTTVVRNERQPETTGLAVSATVPPLPSRTLPSSLKEFLSEELQGKIISAAKQKFILNAPISNKAKHLFISEIALFENHSAMEEGDWVIALQKLQGEISENPLELTDSLTILNQNKNTMPPGFTANLVSITAQMTPLYSPEIQEFAASEIRDCFARRDDLSSPETKQALIDSMVSLVISSGNNDQNAWRNVASIANLDDAAQKSAYLEAKHIVMMKQR